MSAGMTEINQEPEAYTPDGRPMFEGEAVAIFRAEPRRMVLAIYATGLVMALPINRSGALMLQKAIQEFLDNPNAVLPMPVKGGRVQ